MPSRHLSSTELSYLLHNEQATLMHVRLQDITNIDVSGTTLSSNRLRNLASALQGKYFSTINLSHCQLNTSCIDALCHLIQTIKCDSLILNNNQINDQGLEQLSSIIPPTLKQISLVRNNFTDKGAIHLARQAKKTCLEVIDFSDNHLARNPIPVIETIIGHLESSSIRSLAFRNMGICEGAMNIAQSLQHTSTSILKLDLSHNNIGTSQDIKDVMHCMLFDSGLEQLDLRNNNIDLIDITEIEQAIKRQKSSILWLALDNNHASFGPLNRLNERLHPNRIREMKRYQSWGAYFKETLGEPTQALPLPSGVLQMIAKQISSVPALQKTFTLAFQTHTPRLPTSPKGIDEEITHQEAHEETHRKSKLRRLLHGFKKLGI